MREVARLTMAAWIGAALMTSPLIAASQCWSCCVQSGRIDCTDAANDSPRSLPCCAEHERPGTGESTNCPKCSASRPAPIDRDANRLVWQVDQLWILWEQPAPLLTPFILASAEPVPFVAEHIPRPSLQVLNCCWLN